MKKVTVGRDALGESAPTTHTCTAKCAGVFYVERTEIMW